MTHKQILKFVINSARNCEQSYAKSSGGLRVGRTVALARAAIGRRAVVGSSADQSRVAYGSTAAVAYVGSSVRVRSPRHANYPLLWSVACAARTDFRQCAKQTVSRTLRVGSTVRITVEIAACQCNKSVCRFLDGHYCLAKITTTGYYGNKVYLLAIRWIMICLICVRIMCGNSEM